MKAKPYTLLLHPAFLASLTVLLLNDLYLKYTWHNELTGKLSDFAGLFVFTIFLFVVFPAYKKTVIVFCILFFCWWKSPLSNSFIQFANDSLSIPLQRTVDYTDMFALAVLPVTLLIRPPVCQASFIRSAAVYAVGIISFFSFCATSMVRRPLLYYPYKHNEVKFTEQFKSSLSEEEVLVKLDPEKLGYKKDSVRFYKIAEPGDFYQRVNNAPVEVYPNIPIANNKDTSLFIKQKEGTFYILPRYILNGDTLLNMEFRISSTGLKKKPTSISILSFQTTESYPITYANRENLLKNYKKHFKRLFKK
jgi:hypothetical protein